MVFTSLQRALIYTLAYSHQWHWPLSLFELHQRLMAKISPAENESYFLPQTKVSLSEVERELRVLEVRGLIESRDGLWALTGFESIFTVRRQREAVAKSKWVDVKQFLTKTKRIPWIKAVFVTGALAVNNVDENDDLDFMIVTAPHRLWLTRLLVVWVVWRAGRRRTWNGFEPNSWCLNLWVTTDDLACFSQRQSLYTAYELHQMQCVYDVDEVESQLWQQNQWVSEYLPQQPRVDRVNSQQVPVDSGWQNWVLNCLNQLGFYLQRWYMLPHRTREVVTESQAFFHPRDTQEVVYTGWVNVLKLFISHL